MDQKEIPTIKNLPPQLGVGQVYIAESDIREAIANRPDWIGPKEEKRVRHGDKWSGTKFLREPNATEETFEVKGADDAVLGSEKVIKARNKDGMSTVERSFTYSDGKRGNTMRSIIGLDGKVLRVDVYDSENNLNTRVTVHDVVTDGMKFEKVTYYPDRLYRNQNLPRCRERYDEKGQLRKRTDFYEYTDSEPRLITLFREDGTKDIEMRTDYDRDLKGIVKVITNYKGDGQTPVRRERIFTGKQRIGSNMLKVHLMDTERRSVETDFLNLDTNGRNFQSDLIERKLVKVDGKWMLHEERTETEINSREKRVTTHREYLIVDGIPSLRREYSRTFMTKGNKNYIAYSGDVRFDMNGNISDVFPHPDQLPISSH